MFDSEPYDEWMETINKLGAFISLCTTSHDSPQHRVDRSSDTGANTHCITTAEEKHLAEQHEGEGDADADQKPSALAGDAKPRISLAAG